MKVFLFFVLPLTSLALSLTACSKEKKGCTNPSAYNYDSEANSDNGSCLYEGSFLFWFDEATSNQLLDTGVTSLDVYARVLNSVGPSEHLGTYDPAVFWTSEPECGEPGTITITRDLGLSKMLSYEYFIEDQNGEMFFGGSRLFLADSCLKSKIIIL